MPRSAFRVLAASLLAGLVSRSGATAATVPARPNVILISIDTLRADRLGTYGCPRPTSPAIDALARESVVFERAYSHSPKTASSHMSIFTGLYPSAHGVLNWEEGGQALSPEIPTLATLLSDAGYRSAATTAGGNVGRALGFQRGFDSYTQHDRGQSLAVAPLALADLASRSRASGRPFLMFLHTYDVHDPYMPSAAVAKLFVDPAYKGRIVSTPEAVEAAAGSSDWVALHQAYWSRVSRRNPADVQRIKDLYDAGIREMDDALAAFFARFRELGLGDDTLLVLVSDHGEEFLEHGGISHNSVYQEVMHVPLIIRLPGAARGGTRVATRVRLIDVMPTLLQLVGLQAPPGIQGETLVPLLFGTGPARDRYVFSEWPRYGARALQAESWKYVQRRTGDELYDLTLDPGETTNVATSHASVVYQARTRTERLQTLSRQSLARVVGGGAAELDAATRRELEALGYLGH
jgi:arylsulfatase A-like enzyme